MNRMFEDKSVSMPAAYFGLIDKCIKKVLNGERPIFNGVVNRMSEISAYVARSEGSNADESMPVITSPLVEWEIIIAAIEDSRPDSVMQAIIQDLKRQLEIVTTP